MKNNLTTKENIFIDTVSAHYKENARSHLSWRKNINAYRILVSEIMLQQTQVSRVIEKFSLWMKVYPTLVHLRKSSLRDVLLLWQGLGYQHRAKALHAIAQHVKEIPRSYEGLVALPGVGRYTASAVLVFAYDMFGYPLVETNIRTALIEHFYKRKAHIDDDTLYKKLSHLETHTKVKHCGARTWYYMLMDYGAHLKSLRISHNAKSKHYSKQSAFKGSLRELRAKVLFALAKNHPIPNDKRTKAVIQKLEQEGYVKRRSGVLTIV